MNRTFSSHASVLWLGAVGRDRLLYIFPCNVNTGSVFFVNTVVLWIFDNLQWHLFWINMKIPRTSVNTAVCRRPTSGLLIQVQTYINLGYCRPHYDMWCFTLSFSFTGFVNVRLEEEKPIFNKQRIDFSPPEKINHFSVCNNQLCMSLGKDTLLR